MTRKKQQKSKKHSPGVFISSLLGSARSTQSKGASDKKVTDRCSPVSELRPNESKNSLARIESVVLCRTVLELALVNIALSGPRRDISGQYKSMAPPVSSSTSSGQSGLSKLMSPVQDLGKSLLGFLIGSPPPNSQQQPPAQSSVEPGVPVCRGAAGTGQSGDSLAPTSPGRQRPPGHPALGPSVGSTPVVIRRNKVARSDTLSTACETATVREEPEADTDLNIVAATTPPVKAMPRNQSQGSRRKKNRRAGDTNEAEDVDRKSSTVQAATTVSPQEVVSKPSRSQSRNSRRRKAKRAAAAAAVSQQCQQEGEDAGDHETGSDKTELVSLEYSDTVSGEQLSQVPGVTNEIENKSHETSYQGGPDRPDTSSHDTEVHREDSRDSCKESALNDTPSEIVIKRKSYKHYSAQNTEDEQNTGFVTARNSVIAECRESESQESPGSEHVEVNPGQSNCHTGGKSLKDVKEIKRKEAPDRQDESDKDSREVAEQPGSVNISDASREGEGAAGIWCQSVTNLANVNSSNVSGPPPPPPLPPQGFLLEGLKLDKKESVLQEDKLLPPKSSGTLRKNKQLSRKDLLINQLSVVDDSFASFLKTQLNISVDPRERPDLPSQAGTLSRKKKERRKRTESECSAGQDSHPTTDDANKTNLEQNSECLGTPDTAACKKSDDNDFDSFDSKPTEISPLDKCKQRSFEIVDKKKCASNARDRPISIIDIEEGTGKHDKTETVIETITTPDTPATVAGLQSVDNSVSQCPEPEVAEKAERSEKPEKSPRDTGADMRGGLSHQAGVMGVTHSQEFTKQNLSKSDSGYSGQEFVEDTDEVNETVDKEDVTPIPIKTELTVDQAMRKYDRIVEQKSVSEIKHNPRPRVLSEGSEFSDDLSESELESQGDEDSKLYYLPL